MGYQRVLVAVDLTDEADEVMAAASNAAGGNPGSLSCISVVRPLAGVYGGFDLAPISQGTLSFEQEALKHAEEQLRNLANAYHVPEDQVHVRLGAPATEIRAAAEALDADLVVLGTHGRHGLGLLLGSTANAVLHGARCDVLAVKIHPQDKP